MNRFELHLPIVDERHVEFSWSENASGLYRRNSFRMELDDARRIPQRLWLLLAMLCFHTHWILLRPLKIKLPHRLLPGEKEQWLRLIHIGFQTLEGHRDSPFQTLEIEMEEGSIELPPPVAIPASDRCATSFSGGRDSLAQTGLLLECSTRPLLVATTSPMPPLNDHSTHRRRQVFQAMALRDDLDFREVTSDFRSSWNNAFSRKCQYPVSVNSMTDTLLYTASLAAASWLEGCSNIYLAAESEVSDNALRNDQVILFHHFMYSIPIQHGISMLLKPWGLHYGSLTCSLRGPHIQSLLWHRYPELAKYQYSCWKVSDTQAACSDCDKCLLTGLGILANGSDPAIIGIDLSRLMRFAALFDIGLLDRLSADALARDRVTVEHKQNILRYIQHSPPSAMRRLRPDLLYRPSGWKSLLVYYRAYHRAMRFNVGPQPGWRAEYGVFMHGPIRDHVLKIYGDMFAAADPSTYAGDLKGNKILVDYLNASGNHLNQG